MALYRRMRTARGTWALHDLSRARLVQLSATGASRSKRFRACSALIRLGNFHSAGRAADNLDLNALSDADALAVARAFLSGRRGVEGDALLETRLAAHDGLPPESDLQRFADLVAVCGWSNDRRIETIGRMIAAVPGENTRSIKLRAGLKWTLFRMRRGLEPDPDLAWYADLDTAHPALTGKRLRYVEHFVADGLTAQAEGLLRAATEQMGPAHPDVLVAALQLDPTRLDHDPPPAGDLAAHFGHAGLLRATAANAPTSPAARALWEACLAHRAEVFGALSTVDRVVTLEAMVKEDCIDAALDLISRHPVPDTVLAATCARALRAFVSGDNHTARDLFASVLDEDPGHVNAGQGYRLALPRTGGTIDGMTAVWDRLGHGLAGAGRTGMRTSGGREAAITLMASGRYAEGFQSKRSQRRCQMLKAKLGGRFLNAERLLRNASHTSLFVIGDDGVGDEMRTAQFYGALAEQFGRVTISCDPRLEPLLARSFPTIEFVLVPRWRAGLDRARSLGDARITGYGPDLPRLLTESCRPHLETADYVTFGQTLFFDHFAGGLPRPAPGGYLRTVPKSMPRDGVLRVGLLWRSHMRTLWRKFMYLQIEDFTPILDLEGVEFWSIQHAIDPGERAFCAANGIRLIDDVDLFNDFDGLSSTLAGLDMAAGLSSAPLELAAAVGTPVRMLGFSPENYYLRTTGGRSPKDRLTCNSEVLAPPWIDFSAPREDCIALVMEDLRRVLIRERDAKRAVTNHP